MSDARRIIIGFAAVALVGFGLTALARTEGVAIPAPAADAALAGPGSPEKTAVVAAGCFWGVQAVYQHVRGVKTAISGYAGGTASTAEYRTVGTGRTAHAESVAITYDPSRLTYGQLLRVFFSVAHDPTTLNRQGPDYGTQYRSAIFFEDAEQERIARAYIAQLDSAHVFEARIVTEVTKLPGFYRAEDYHQDYATLHPSDPYIVINDAPKVVNLQRLFPDLYAARPSRR
ncbi:MAG: peptide-methionine (S)-S-oxide reductase MsrA [Vicinamibacterales bacterium]